jgi:hypothetical protein
MMMRMLQAGGMPLLVDGVRTADADNPRGYFEFDRAKRLRQDSAWIPLSVGKAVKVISFLLPSLPAGYEYRVIFMERPLAEVIASQAAMLERQGTPVEGERDVEGAFRKHLIHIRQWLKEQAEFKVLPLQYQDVLADPHDCAGTISRFLDRSLDETAMASAVEASLWRQRG